MMFNNVNIDGKCNNGVFTWDVDTEQLKEHNDTTCVIIGYFKSEQEALQFLIA
uniref:Uncharacterized protein n=1 Tax=viral metagenome TaxID=1070528 RepID=A0A6M3LKG3_9ZZZZ